MAEKQKRRFIDVWIVESNTVYREVPFTVVTDWVQQGRLLADDKVRPSGTAEWYPIGGSATFNAYMPKVEANRAEDQAEAMEPVQVDFSWKRRPEDEDEDVDMIPLIDISLVLLIFFMMTAAVAAGVFDINTPAAQRRNMELADDMKLWVGIDIRETKGGPVVTDLNHPWYSLGLKEKILVKPTHSPEQVMGELRNLVETAPGRMKIRLRADRSIPIEVIQDMTIRLKNLEIQANKKKPGRITVIIVGEVSEPKKF